MIVPLSERRGTPTLTTRDASGKTLGTATECSYDAYAQATAQYPGCPSAGYELLRFGRVLGPDALAASDQYRDHVPHLRKIKLHGSDVYIDLNVPGVQVYSDADFPEWQGWTFIDDDTDGNSRCDSAQLLDLILAQLPPPAALPAEAQRDRLLRAHLGCNDRAVRERLKRCVVKMPTEWARDDFDTRWGWVRNTQGDLPANVLLSACLTPEAYEKFRRHHAALAFWEDAKAAGLALDKVHYHFHPKLFVETFKKCGWLSPGELKQAVPQRSLRSLSAGLSGKIVYENALPRAGQLASTHTTALNRALRKYAINTPVRMAAFLGNALPETAWLRIAEEAFAGNRWYAPWIGRGFLQLTHPGNYLEYWHWRGRTIDPALARGLKQAQQQADNQRSNRPLQAMEAQLPAQIPGWRDAVSGVDSTDSAGFYWVMNKANLEADAASPNVRHAFTVDASSQQMHGQAFVFYENLSFRRVSCLINLPGHINRADPQLNGLVDRYHAHAYAQVLLLDQPVFPDTSGVLQFLPEDCQVKDEAKR